MIQTQLHNSFHLAEQKAAFFQQVSCCPLDRKNVELPKQTSPLAGSCEGDMRQRSDTCSGSALFPYRVLCQFVPSTARGNASRLGALRTGGMSSSVRPPLDESCSPVPATISRALRSAAHQSLHGFADLSLGCQCARSCSALFVCLWLHPPCCSVKRSRILLTQDLADQIADLPRFPQVKSLFQLRVPTDTFRDFSFCPSRCVSRNHAPRECHRGGSAKLGQQLLVSLSQSNVADGTSCGL